MYLYISSVGLTGFIDELENKFEKIKVRQNILSNDKKRFFLLIHYNTYKKLFPLHNKFKIFVQTVYISLFLMSKNLLII